MLTNQLLSAIIQDVDLSTLKRRVTVVSRFEQFSAVISSIYRCIQNIEREEMIKVGYKGAYAIYLVTMARYPEGLTAAQLSEYCVKDKAAVSRIVAEMEARGLIRRAGNGENLYRAKLLLTPEGERLAEFVKQKARAAISEISGKMSDEDRSVMYKALDTISRNLEIISKDGIPEDSVH